MDSSPIKRSFLSTGPSPAENCSALSTGPSPAENCSALSTGPSPVTTSLTVPPTGPSPAENFSALSTGPSPATDFSTVPPTGSSLAIDSFAMVEIASENAFPGKRRFFHIEDHALCFYGDEVTIVDNRSHQFNACLCAITRSPRKDAHPLRCGCPYNQASIGRSHNHHSTCKAWQLEKLVAQ